MTSWSVVVVPPMLPLAAALAVGLRDERRRQVALQVLRYPHSVAGGVAVLALLGSRAVIDGEPLLLVPAVLASGFIAAVIYAATAPVTTHPARRQRL